MKTKSNNQSGKILSISALITYFLFICGCAPYINSVNPNSGYPGTQVSIQGGRFGATVADNTVKFGNIPVPASDLVVASTTSISAIVPTGAVTALVSVTTKNGTGESKNNFIVPSKRDWTFMVYLDADNNLESAGLDDFLEMASVRSSDHVTILVQMDRVNGHSTGYGDWKDTRRFVVKENSTPSSAPVANLGELNMGNPSTLSDFVQWGITNYPAEHYALSIWNHGDGWRVNQDEIARISSLKSGGPDETIVKAVASDDTDNDILYMREVQDALADARLKLESKNLTKVKIDVIGFDACLMGMVEVAYALRDLTNYMVGSEETEPADGWPYEEILSDLVSTPTMSPETLAKRIVLNYGNSYSSGITQAAYDMSKLGTLVQKIDAFTSNANSEWNVLKNARANSTDYHIPGWSSIWGTDIYDFADETYKTVTSASLKTAATELKNAIDAFVIEEVHSTNMSGSNGVAIYFPTDLISFNNDPQHTGYQESNTFMIVDYVKQHQWDNWLPTFYSNIP